MSDERLRALLTARVPTAFHDMRPYVPDPAKVEVRLDANEAPSILPTLQDDERRAWELALTAIEPSRYPDVRATQLRAALAEGANVSPDQLVLGCGSDEVISLLLTTLARPLDGEPPLVLVPAPTFVMYRMAGRVHGYDIAEVPLDARFDLDEARLGEAIGKLRPAVVFLATPNNPTSRAFDLGKVERIIELAGRGDPPTLVVVDEAYLPYRLGDGDPWRGQTGLHLLARHAHVLVVRTLSKVGFAGLRVGWAIGRRELVAEIEKTRTPYNLSTTSQAGALAALTSLAPAVQRHVGAVVAERARLASELGSFAEVSFSRSDANFFWLRVRDAAKVASALKEGGVLVRAIPTWGDNLRVTVGTRAEDDRFLEVLRAALGR